MSSPWPDLIVGVDFGTTGTAVAYAKPSDDKVHQLTKWPGESDCHDKVPSMVVFEGNKVEAWGFGVKNLQSITNIRFYKLFKPLFDSGDNAQAAEAERCVRAFLKELRICLEEALPLEEQLKNLDWKEIKIKYVFSYPTTWGDGDQDRFSDIVKEAGYQTIDEDQRRMTSLDEAQASMMHFLFSDRKSDKALPKKNERVLVADIGGGTSDVSIFKVLNINGRELELFREVADEGKDIGSTQVDDLFKVKLREEVKKEFQKRLQGRSGAQELRDDIMNVHVDAAVLHVEQSSDYTRYKHAYGRRALHGKMQPSEFPLRIADLVTSGPQSGDQITFPVDIHRERFFEDAFLGQCDKIWDQCKTQMDLLEDEKATIQHIVLAGGFGSSPYVVTKLSEHFRGHARSKEATVVEVDNAQLAVSRGLVHEELLNLYGDHGWLYPAHYSYGIQKGEDKDDIRWFVKRGEEVKVPYVDDVTRHINMDQFDSDGKLMLDLKLVRTINRPTWGITIKSDTERNKWNRSIETVKDLSGWVKECLPLPHNLKADLSFRKRRAAVTFKIRMARMAIALSLHHAKAEHGRLLVLCEDWHDPPGPKGKSKANKAKKKGSTSWSWGLQETLAAVGVGIGAGAIVVAVMSYFNDKKGNEKPDEAAESGGKQEYTGSDPVAPPSADAIQRDAGHGHVAVPPDEAIHRGYVAQNSGGMEVEAMAADGAQSVFRQGAAWTEL